MAGSRIGLLGCAAVATLLALTGLTARADGDSVMPPLRFAPERDYGPFVYQDEAGVVKGLSVDILAAVSQAAGLRVETLPARNLSEILVMAQRVEVDIVSSLRPTPERAKYLEFSRPYVSVPAVLVRLEGVARRSSLSDLDGQRVAVGAGYAVESYLRAKFPAVRWVAMADDVVALRALLKREVQGVVADIASVGFATRQYDLKGIQVHGPVGFEYALSFAYPNDRPDIGDALDRGLRAIRAGERDAVLRRWIDAETMQYRNPSAGAVNLVAAGAASVALVLLAVALVRRVRLGVAR